MTRKKWNKLRKRYPQLFGGLPCWEAMTPFEWRRLKPYSEKEAIARMHSLFISDYLEFEGLPKADYCDCVNYAFNPAADRPAQAVPLQVPGLAGKLWTPDPGFPPQSWENLERKLREQSAALDKALAHPANHPPVELGQDSVLVEGKFNV